MAERPIWCGTPFYILRTSPYGPTITATGSQASSNKYRYIGAFIDDTSTGNYKLGARYYNQLTGRFTQPDPSGQETNRYNYATSNPATYADASGLSINYNYCCAEIIGACAGVHSMAMISVSRLNPPSGLGRHRRGRTMTPPSLTVPISLLVALPASSFAGHHLPPMKETTAGVEPDGAEVYLGRVQNS